MSSYLGLLQDERVTVVEVAEAAGSPYLEDFEVGLDVSAHATALVPRRSAEEPAWAVVVAVTEEDVSERIATEVSLAAGDLAGGTSH